MKSNLAVWLEGHEQFIARDPDSHEAGQALVAIRNGRLYRETGSPSFEVYCERRWRLSRSRLSELMAAAERAPAAAATSGDLSRDQAAQLTRRIKRKAGVIRDDMQSLISLVEQAKTGNAHTVLGFKSWTAYVSDTMAGLRLQLPPEKRLEWVGYLTGEGMSAAAIAPVVGASQRTIERDRTSDIVSEVESPQVMGLDGRQRPPAPPRPQPVETVSGEVLEPDDPLLPTEPMRKAARWAKEQVGKPYAAPVKTEHVCPNCGHRWA